MFLGHIYVNYKKFLNFFFCIWWVGSWISGFKYNGSPFISCKTHNQRKPPRTSQIHPKPPKTTQNQLKPPITSQTINNHPKPAATIQNQPHGVASRTWNPWVPGTVLQLISVFVLYLKNGVFSACTWTSSIFFIIYRGVARIWNK